MSDPFKNLHFVGAEEGAAAAPLALPKGSASAEPAVDEKWQRSESRLVMPPKNAVSSDAAAPVAIPPTAAVTPMGAMLARHVLRDGEVVLLVLKPSLWFILLSSLRFLAVVAILTLAAIAYEGQHNREWFYIEAGIFIAAGRIMWAVLQWMGRLYVLTDLRVIRLSGVFKVDIFDCALRKVARTGVTQSSRERCCATGTIEIVPAVTGDGQDCPPGQWQTVARPHKVHELIVSTINKAKQHGYGAAA